MNLHGIPNDQGAQRCQAVAGNGEGKVPTTAPACASESPGSNSAAGADDGFGSREYWKAANSHAVNRLGEELAKNIELTQQRDHEAERAKAAIRMMTKLDRERAALARALESLMLCGQNALETMDHGSDRYDLAVSVENAKELLTGGGGAERQGEQTCEQSRAASPSSVLNEPRSDKRDGPAPSSDEAGPNDSPKKP